MTRQVTLRDPKFDGIKGLIATHMADDPLSARAWANARWGQDQAPTEIHKAADALDVDYLDSTSSGALFDRALFAAVREKSVLFRMRGTRRGAFRSGAGPWWRIPRRTACWPRCWTAAAAMAGGGSAWSGGSG